MQIHLIDGQFSANDAVDIVTRLIHVKIKFHEEKINQASNEEDVKMREKRIKQLQKELFEVRNNLLSNKTVININGTIDLS